jgi:NDP-sugar pyrophosphorylase family protein
VPAPINGRALLDYQLETLAEAGITDITVVAGHLADRVVQHVAGRCRVIRNDRYASSNSIVSLHANACLVDPLRPHVDGEFHVELRQGRIVRYSRDVPPGGSVGESGQLVKIGARDFAAFLDRLGRSSARAGSTSSPTGATTC